MSPNEAIMAELMRRATYAANRVGAELAGQLKRVLSVAAPLVPGANPPRAATKATPGAPPRLVSGRGRAATTYYVEPSSGGKGVTLYVGNSVIYMGVHERGNHKWLEKNINIGLIREKFRKYFEEAR